MKQLLINAVYMKLTFKVQGSASDPYTCEFWREGENLSSSCTCPAGEKGMYCKHRLSLIAGEITNLVSKNISDIEVLKKMVLGTDVEKAIKLVKKSEEASEKLKSIFAKKPDRRRSDIYLHLAKSVLLNNGILKANGETNKLDLYDENVQYVGSYKLNSSVFKEEMASHLSDISLKKMVKPFKGIMSVYYYLADSQFNNLLEEESKLQEYKQKLKINLKD